MKSLTFEEELYRFITHLNFNVPKIRDLLDLDFATSTRFIPRYIRTWVHKYEVRSIYHLPGGLDLKIHFGLPENRGVLETRIVRGKLSPCTSNKILLSLNDDLAVKTKLPCGWSPYNSHYSERWNVLIPLAYNPMENVII
jgi:hypothetical protein